MVSWISNWAKGIIMAVIIATIIEMILPEGNNKKYIKLVIGVYVLFSVINPIISAINGKEFEFNEEKYSQYFNNTYQASSEAISQSNDNNIEKIYEENIKTDIKQKLKNKGYVVKEINIVIKTGEEDYGNIEKVSMKIIKSEENTTSKPVNSISVNKIEIGNNTTNDNKTSEVSLTSNEIREIKKYISDTYSIAEKYIQIN